MKDNYSHICIVLDASGSMCDIEEDTRKSFDKFIEEQKNGVGDATLDVYQFADSTHKVVDFIDLNKDNCDVMRKYRCEGCTALYDAICVAIDETGAKLAAMPESARPSKVLMVILTDGMENASRKFNVADVKQRIKHQSEVYSWSFVFLAANQDAVLTGGEIGIDSHLCANICASTSHDAMRNSAICSRVFSYARFGRKMNVADIADEIDREFDAKKNHKNHK